MGGAEKAAGGSRHILPDCQIFGRERQRGKSGLITPLKPARKAFIDAAHCNVCRQLRVSRNAWRWSQQLYPKHCDGVFMPRCATDIMHAYLLCTDRSLS